MDTKSKQDKIVLQHTNSEVVISSFR